MDTVQKITTARPNPLQSGANSERLTSGQLALAPSLAYVSALSKVENGTFRIESYPGIQHLELSKEYINNLITTPTCLYFFWATGTNSNINPDFKAYIGGLDRHKAFKAYCERLIQLSPDYLVINLTLDELTYSFNKNWLDHMVEHYPTRFSLCFVEKDLANLLKQFPNYQGCLNTIFNNATKGNPVLASDVFRLFLLFFQDQTTEKTCKMLHTYSDIDTFCAGLETTIKADAAGYTQLLQALFQNLSNESSDNAFRWAARQPSTNCNDIIKLQVGNRQEYLSFCNTLLELWNNPENNYIIHHFTKLHSILESCINKDPEEALDTYIQHVSATKPIAQSIEIMGFAGPNFIRNISTYNDCQTLAVYPITSDWGWHGTQMIEDAYSIFFPDRLFEIEDEEKRENFKNILQKYIQHIHNLPFLRRILGNENILYTKILEYLNNNFPFESQLFQEIFLLAYAKKVEQNPEYTIGNYISFLKRCYFSQIDPQDVPEDTSMEDFLSDYPYFTKMLYVLAKFGIKKSFTEIFEKI